MRAVRKYWLLGLAVLAVVVLYAKGLGARSYWDPDETRYAEIGREMLVSGDWVVPRLNGFKYYEKPPLTYWSTATSYALFGESEGGGRIGPLVATLLLLGATWLTGKALYDTRSAWLGTFVLALSPLAWGTGRMLLTDIFLAAGVACATAGYALALGARASVRARAPAMIFMGLGFGIALLAKGPVGVVIPLFGIIPFRLLMGRKVSLGSGSWAIAAAAAGALALPWYITIAVRDPAWTWFFFVHEHLLRYLTSDAHREHGAWYYFVVLLFGFFPVSMLLPWAFRRTWPGLRPAARVDSGTLLLLLQAVLTFLFFTVSRSKLVTYILPAAPAFALIAGRAVALVLDASGRVPKASRDEATGGNQPGRRELPQHTGPPVWCRDERGTRHPVPRNPTIMRMTGLRRRG